ncbi:hypothetical protein [Heyndrickxia ginsengihumi]|nr:hypothetical protein [Heyndrickxia ginsengihumi]
MPKQKLAIVCVTLQPENGNASAITPPLLPQFLLAQLKRQPQSFPFSTE